MSMPVSLYVEVPQANIRNYPPCGVWWFECEWSYVLICLNVWFSVGGLFRKNEYRCGLVGEGVCCGILILDVFHLL